MLIDVALNGARNKSRERSVIVTRPRSELHEDPSICGSLNAALDRIEAGAADMRTGAEDLQNISDDTAGSRYANYANDILSASQHLARVLASLSQQTEHDGNIGRDGFDIAAVLDEAVRLVRPLRAAKGIDIRLGGTLRDLPSLLGDRRRVQQILLNLLSNALKFSPAGSQILISVGIESTARIRIADAGPGISAEDRERIFEPFERLQSGKEGMGLGLAISRRYAAEMQGRLYAEESELGGAALILELPLA